LISNDPRFDITALFVIIVYSLYVVMKPGNISNQRILAEVRKLSSDKPEDMRAGPLPDDLYTWHFTFRGPINT
jgi:hypothetical protein